MMDLARNTSYRSSFRWNMEPVVPAALVLLCTLFNFFLCFVNTNIVGLNVTHVVLTEMALIGISLYWGFKSINEKNLYWVFVVAVLAVITLVMSFGKHELAMKPMRDVLILPVFVALGLSAQKANFTKILLWLSIFITFIALLEAFAAKQFLDVFNFKDYFVAKGAMEDLEWLSLNTFASGVRPGGRFLFDLPGVHRIASVFLEPVSLGFYGFISGLYFIARKNNISQKSFWFGLFLSFILIWLSDGRMALSCLMYTFLLRTVFIRMDHRFNIIVAPIMFLFAYIIDTYELMDITGEGMGARFHSTMEVFHRLDYQAWAGFPADNVYVADSGLATILNNLGLLGLLLYWLSPFFYLKKASASLRIYMAGLAFYIGFGFIISGAIFSIKTAALLWFILGYLVVTDSDHENNERQNS